MTDPIPESDQQFVQETVAKLGEMFDSVRVFVTVHDGSTSTTHSYETGSGNFYAQLGQIREWLAIQDQYQRQHAKRKDAQNEEEDE